MVAGCFLLTLYQSLVRSFNHYSYAEIPLLYAMYLLALFSIFDKGFEKKKEGDGFSKEDRVLFVVLTFFCLSYSLTGIYRLVYGGMTLFQSNSFLIWMVQGTNTQTLVFSGIERWILDHHWAMNLIKYTLPIVTIFQIFASLCLISKKFRVMFVCVMGYYYFLLWGLFQLLYWEYLALFILFFELSSWTKPEAQKVAVR